MLTVQANYTACVGRQDLPESTQALYRLVARLAGFASGADEHPFTTEDASDVVRCIDRYVMETASEFGATSRDLSTMIKDTELYRLHAAVGDYAKVLCNALKETGGPNDLKQHPWTTITSEIDDEKRLVTAWKASSADLPEPETPFTDALEAAVATLVACGLTDVDNDLALFAARTYARRNFVFHGKTDDLFRSGEYADLANFLDLDDKILDSLLPDTEKPLVGKYRRLISFFRDYRICKDRTGKWNKRQALQVPPKEEVPVPFMLPSEAALRSSMESGKFRPIGLSGPPLLGVSFSPASFRRHTVGDPRGSKRPAEEQPPGQPRTKAVCGLDYGGKKVGAVGNKLSDDDHIELGRLVDDLHNLADQLTRLSPSLAKNLFAVQVPQLEGSLKRIKGKLDKKRRKAEKTQSK